jgi:hypothetical protein
MLGALTVDIIAPITSWVYNSLAVLVLILTINEVK